ncbi:MAG: F390 synthetase-related protein [Cyanobacteria bacterium J06560_5]
MRKILSILWHYWLTQRRQFASAEALHDWQDKRVQKFLKKVLAKSPFYATYYQGLDIEEWETFPLMNKSLMMENFDRLNTVGITQVEAMAIAQKAETTRDFRSTLGPYTVGLSSGTSGNRGLFLVSQAEQRAWAGTLLAKALPQSIFTHQRIAFFLRANSNLYETVQGQRIEFEYFDLFKPIENHIARLNFYEPTVLVAPASMLRLLAEALMRGELAIDPIRIVSVAEVLDPLDERVIVQAFGQKVHQLYQCTEGFLATTCPEGTLHLNEDILVIQKDYLDRAAGKFSPIITDFNRVTQPIIRYRLDDVLTERSEPCPCGSVLTAVEHIEGRCDDIFYLRSRTRSQRVPVFPDFIRRAVILSSDVIQEYAVVQTQPETIQVFLKLPVEAWTTVTVKIENALQSLFEQLGCDRPTIFFRPYEGRSQHDKKLRRIRRDFQV